MNRNWVGHSKEERTQRYSRLRNGKRRTFPLSTGAFAAACLLAAAATWASLPPLSAVNSQAPGAELTERSREARELAARKAALLARQSEEATIQGERAGDEVGPFEDIASSATLFLLDEARPESLEALEIGDGLRITGRIRIADAEIYIIEPSEPLLFEAPIMTLSAAMANGVVDIRELQGNESEMFHPQYPSGGGGMIVARNKGDVYILLVGGEVLDGGNQDRIVASTAILPPGGDWIPLPVNCVEQGRSQGDSLHFQATGDLAHPVLRVHSQSRANQRAVWNEIGRIHQIEGSSNPTHTYVGALTQGRNRVALTRQTHDIGALLDAYPETVGLVFARGGRVQSFERMATPDLFRAQRRTILDSHLTGLATQPVRGLARAAALSSVDTTADAKVVREDTSSSLDDLTNFFVSMRAADRLRPPLDCQGIGVTIRGETLLGGETLTNLAPRDPVVRTFVANLSRGGPLPGVLNQWAVRLN